MADFQSIVHRAKQNQIKTIAENSAQTYHFIEVELTKAPFM